MSLTALRGLIDSLRTAIEGLSWHPPRTEWTEYDAVTNYSTDARRDKERLVREFLRESRGGVVWDLGANTGRFARVAAETPADVIAFDADDGATELDYLACRSAHETRILPLVVDLTNPSPAIGWSNSERSSLTGRGPADVVLALALVHHLAIGNNLPLDRIAEFLHAVSRDLIVEFVPREDSQVQRLLASREDVFDDYSRPGFERAFGRYFVSGRVAPVAGSQRTLYLMRRRDIAA
jgi:ribosomal protein L11 methylase PrmA